MTGHSTMAACCAEESGPLATEEEQMLATSAVNCTVSKEWKRSNSLVWLTVLAREASEGDYHKPL